MITDYKIIEEFRSLKRDMGFYIKYNERFAEMSPEAQAAISEYGEIRPRHCSPALIQNIYKTHLLKTCPGFVFDENNKAVIKLISQRISETPEFETLSPTYGCRKGIFLLGTVGSGKTILMRGLISMLNDFRHLAKEAINPIHELPTYAITETFSKIGVEVYRKCYYGNNDVPTTYETLFIDDLGAETVSNHYGQVTNVLGEIILRRYDNKVLTFATSNLDQKTLNKFYGPRVWSRMKEMFNFFELKGNDRRN